VSQVSDKTVKIVLYPPIPLPAEIPQEYAEDPIKAMLYGILVKIDSLEKTLREVYTDNEDYLYVEDSVDSSVTREYNIYVTLNRISKSGWIVNDGTSDIFVKINGRDKIRIKAGEKFEWGVKAARIVVRRLTITTDSTSSQAYRLFAT